jgi:Zn-dependent protease with chaperone function
MAAEYNGGRSPDNRVALTIVALCVALAPACLSAWSGYRLRRRLDDAAFPERLQAHRRAVMLTCFVAGGVLVGLKPGLAAAFVPLLLLALSVAAYPTRKAIYGETWGYIAYVSWMARLVTAFAGFWLLLAAAPLIVLAMEHSGLRIAVSILAAVLLTLWSMHFVPIARWLVRPRPLEDPEMLAAFGEILSRSQLSEAGIEVVAPRGARLANAMALATLHERHVWLGRTLLDLLSRDEAIAIFAHEVAHLEQFTPLFLWRLRIIDVTLIVLGTIGAAFASLFLPGCDSLWLFAGWGLAFVLLLALRGRGHQRRETESDLRAAALCGDADAVVRGLVKLHSAARLPRRWAEDAERAATHPSLASRIRALRDWAAQPAPTLGEPQVFATTDGALVLEGARLHWLEGLPDAGGDIPALFDRAEKARTLAYSGVRELRLAATIGGRVRLIARDLSGQRWSVPIREADTARLQRALDTIEFRLAPRSTGISHSAGRLLAGLAILLGLTQFAWGLILCAATALLRLRPVPLLMLAAAAATSAVLTVLQPSSPDFLVSAWLLVPLEAGLAAAAVSMAYRQIQAERTRWDDGPPLMLAVVAVGAVASWSFALTDLLSAPGLVRAHQIAQSTPAAAVLAAALATAFLAGASGPRRTAGVLAGLLALGAVAIASPSLLFAVERDALLARTPYTDLRPAHWKLHSVADVGELEYGGPLRVSPSGRRYALGRQSADQEIPIEFRVGEFGASGHRTVRGLDVAWITDDRLLVLKLDGEGTALTLIDPTKSSAERWSRALPRIIAPRLKALDHGPGWMLIGWTTSMQRRAIRVTGTLDSPDVERTEWEVPGDDYVETVTASARGNAIAVTQKMAGAGSLLWTLRASTTMAWWTDSTIWALTPDGPRRIADTAMTARCVEPSDADSTTWCVATDSQRTIVYAVNVPEGRLEAVTTVPRHSFFESNGPDGSLVLWADWTRPLIVRPLEHVAVELDDDAIPVALSTAGRGGLVSFLSSGAHSGQIRLLELQR